MVIKIVLFKSALILLSNGYIIISRGYFISGNFISSTMKFVKDKQNPLKKCRVRNNSRTQDIFRTETLFIRPNLHLYGKNALAN